MKDVKLKEKFEKVFEAFFENGETNSNYLERMSADTVETLHSATESDNKPKIKNILILLKQLFLFLPATFFTFYMWMGMMIFGFPITGTILFFFLLLILPFFMVLGMGNIKNIRHWIMPLMVIILGSSIGILMSGIPFLQDLIRDFENAVLFFPLALIVAVLSKNWADKPNENDSL